MIYNNLAKKNSLNTFLNKYFNLFVVVFVSFLLFIAYLLILQPKVSSTAAAISENISSHQKLLQAEKIKLANLKEAISNYDNIDTVDLDRINHILPNDYDKELLYGEIEELITKNGFTPLSITLAKEGETSAGAANASAGDDKGEAKDSSKIGVINISLNIASVDYAGLKNLLTILESNLRLLDVKKLSLDGGHSGSLEISTYYYKK
ncbi:MAG: hypothetical protein WCK59_01445 [Candidatus Falkowbacteria bacterium]